MPQTLPGEAPESNPVKQYRSYHKASYSFEQVIADLIDNSIDANATFVEVRLGEQDLSDEPKEHRYLSGRDNLYCLIIDDGRGIPESNMRAILSRGFDRSYDEIELGSYGVGLKDSSLSQAYEVTLFSKTEPDGAIGRRRLSSCLVMRHEAERIFREDDLDLWMRQTEGYQSAIEALESLDHGTVVLLEGMHKLELKIAEGDRETYTNAIRERCKNYVRLVFQRYMEGVHIPRRDGTTTYKKLDVYWEGREPFHRLLPLDPFYREPEFRDGSRKGTTSITRDFETRVQGVDEPGRLTVTAWLLPHRKSYPRVTDRQNEMKTTKEGKWEDTVAVGGVGLVKLQGAYIYRNMRLVQFAPDRDPWLGIMTEDSHLNQMRLEVHLPPGREVGGDSSEFNINTSKSQVEVAYRLRNEIKRWAQRPGETFHEEDPRTMSLKQRAELRNGDDKWKSCPLCGSEGHTRGKCPNAPRCPICNSRRHTEPRYCPRRPPCEICGTTDHLTADHPDPTERVDASMRHEGVGTDTQPELDALGRVDSPERPGPDTADPSAGGVTPTVVRVRPVADGPLLVVDVADGELTIRINPSDPLYDQLKAALRSLP